MTARARHLLGTAAWWASLAAALAWWAPAIMLALARLWGGRLRFRLALGLGRTLAAVGLSAAASRVYAVELARCERRRRGLEGRRGW